MTRLQPFFLLVGRASVFWLGAFAMLSGAMIAGVLAKPDARRLLDVDAGLIAALWFPAAAGWLGGLAIQEFQTTTFARHLPGVGARLAAGYLGTGLVLSLALAALIGQASSTPLGLPLLFALGLGAYGVGGVLRDPLSTWMTGTNTVLAVLVLLRSRDLARIASEHPWLAATVWLAVGAAAVARLFARSTFQRSPLRPTKPLPGRFSLEKSQAAERRRAIAGRSTAKTWGVDLVGDGPWVWVRAAVHETHGPLGWKIVPQTIGRMWGLGLLVALYAWVDRGDLSYGEAIGRSLFDALFRSPHQPPFGEKGGPFVMVAIVIAAAGIVKALFHAVALSDGLPYPLSRPQRAQVTFRCGLVDAAILLVILGTGLYAVGQATGLLLGYPARFDFMPYYFRVLLVTLILTPLGHWGRLRLREAARRKAENSVVAVAFGVTAFVVAVCVAASVLPLIVPSPLLELIALGGALLISQWLYRRKLTDYFRHADLV